MQRSGLPLAVLVSAAFLAAGILPGGAAAQTSQNIVFLSNLDPHPPSPGSENYNDVWGYTAPNGDEYALLGVYTGVSVINLTDPTNPYETGFIPGPYSIWRDIKTYQHYAYVTNESSGGLDIIDLSDPENPAGLPNYTGFSSAHNVYVDAPTARAYIAGSDLFSGGVRILSLANPTAPVEIGSWETRYFHDVMVQNNRLYGSAIYAGALYILDVTNPSPGSITTLGTKSGYPSAFTHNAWVTPDDNYVITTDETAGAACRMWDISNLPTINQTGIYLPNPATIPHNTHIKGDYAYISHYSLGVRVVDISDPFNLTEVGYYDTYPSGNGGGYVGCWGAFPFFGTTPGLFVASDQVKGLFVLRYDAPIATDAPAIAAGPEEFRLGAATPNPLRRGEVTALALNLPREGEVSAQVIDVTGRRVAELVDRRLPAGAHTLRWNGRTRDGNPAAAGAYFVVVRTPEGERTGKITLVR